MANAAGQPPRPPGASPPPGPKPGGLAATVKKHPWWFIGGGGAVAVVLFVWYEHSKQSSQQQQGKTRNRVVVFRGRGRGHGRGHHGPPHGKPPPKSAEPDAGQHTDEQNLLDQVDAMQSALQDYTSTHARDRAPGGALPATPLPEAAAKMTPQPF